MRHTSRLSILRLVLAPWPALLLTGCGALSCSSSQGGGGTAGDGGRKDDAASSLLSPCISDWPSAGRVPQARASLQVSAGSILWSREVPNSWGYHGYLFENSGLVMSKGHLVFAPVARPLILVDKDGNVSQTDPMPAGYDEASPATVDEDGNLYSVGLSGLYSFDPSGKIRWHLSTANNTGAEFMSFYPPGLSPEGILYAVCGDGLLRAVEARDGKELWRQAADVRTGPSQVMGGGGGAVFLLNGISGVHAYDSRTGQHLGELGIEAHPHLYAFKGWWALGWDFGVQFGALYSFDVCGRLRWSTITDSLYMTSSGIIALAEVLVATQWDIDSSGNRLSPDRMYRYAADGTVVQGPVGRGGEPFLDGADGTIYAVNCAFSSPKANELIAYTSDLKELWRLNLGVSNGCPVGNGVLDDDGVLYLVRSVGGGVNKAEIVAIQTQSPGLAESSWPSLRHDNRGTMWLAPLGPPKSASADGGTAPPQLEGGTAESGPTMDTGIDVSIGR
jgi:outer membrane protein assembly factor BamB